MRPRGPRPAPEEPAALKRRAVIGAVKTTLDPGMTGKRLPRKRWGARHSPCGNGEAFLRGSLTRSGAERALGQGLAACAVYDGHGQRHNQGGG